MSYKRTVTIDGPIGVQRISGLWRFSELSLGGNGVGGNIPLPRQIDTAKTALSVTASGPIVVAGTYGNAVRFPTTGGTLQTFGADLTPSDTSWEYRMVFNLETQVFGTSVAICRLVGSFAYGLLMAYGGVWRCAITLTGASFDCDIVGGAVTLGLHEIYVRYDHTTTTISFVVDGVVLGTSGPLTAGSGAGKLSRIEWHSSAQGQWLLEEAWCSPSLHTTPQRALLNVGGVPEILCDMQRPTVATAGSSISIASKILGGLPATSYSWTMYRRLTQTGTRTSVATTTSTGNAAVTLTDTTPSSSARVYFYELEASFTENAATKVLHGAVYERFGQGTAYDWPTAASPRNQPYPSDPSTVAAVTGMNAGLIGDSRGGVGTEAQRRWRLAAGAGTSFAIAQTGGASWNSYDSTVGGTLYAPALAAMQSANAKWVAFSLGINGVDVPSMTRVVNKLLTDMPLTKVVLLQDEGGNHEGFTSIIETQDPAIDALVASNPTRIVRSPSPIVRDWWLGATTGVSNLDSNSLDDCHWIDYTKRGALVVAEMLSAIATVSTNVPSSRSLRATRLRAT